MTRPAKELSDLLAAHAGPLSLFDRIKLVYRPFICPMSEVLGEIPFDSRHFDIGCGNGALPYLALTTRNTEISHGYDVSEQSVASSRIFRNANQSTEKRLAVSYLAPQDTPPPLDDYDCITMIDVLHHVPRRQQQSFLSRVMEKMNVGAKLVIADIDGSHRLATTVNLAHDLVSARELVAAQPASQVVSTLEDSSASVESCRHQWDLWYLHFIVVATKRKN